MHMYTTPEGEDGGARREDHGDGWSPAFLAPTREPGWCLVEEGYSRAREHEIESLFTVANGYIGTRGSLSEGGSMTNPATFVAGVFVSNPEPDSVPGLLSIPDWTDLQVFVERTRLSLEQGCLLGHRRILDLRQGLLWREWRHRDPVGRVTRLWSLRLASLGDRHLLLQTTIVTPENYAGRVQIEARLGPLHNGLPWTVLPSMDPGDSSDSIVMQTTTGRGETIALAIAGEAGVGHMAGPAHAVERLDESILERWTCEVPFGESLRMTRIVSVHSSRETERPSHAARRRLAEAREQGIPRVIRMHVERWNDRWGAAGLEILGDDEAQRALRFAAYHLISAANPEDERTSVGARALTGDSYKGHVFWDTEIYVLPFYTLTDPATARALLMYRYRTLPSARRKARRLGYDGALYAWESTDTGEETTPPVAVTPEGEVVRILTGEQEHHISADVAYAVWQYWQATGDEAFLVQAGAEMLIESARFWASRAHLESDGRHHIRRVIGPDEYHETVDDNAYTNVMAQWNLRRGADVVRLLQSRWPQEWAAAAGRLLFRAEEPETWLRTADSIETGFDPHTRLFEQFHGYFGLEEIDLPKQRPPAIDVWLGRERLQRSKPIKQADVVAISALLWDQFPREVHEANFRYYEPRTAHGSSLSPALHAMVAARLGDAPLAEAYFRQAAEIDLANNMGNAAGGVHIAALGGLWQAAVFGMAGMRLRESGLAFAPHVPATWRRFSFSIQWRGRRLRVTLGRDPSHIEVHLLADAPMEVELIDGPRAVIHPGTRFRAERDHRQWRAWEKTEA